MIIAIDFDGTIVTHAWPAIGRDIGAFEWLRSFQGMYDDLRFILWTVRADEPLMSAMDYCSLHGLHFWAINANPQQRSWSPSNKAYAHLYVDDAALGAPLIYPEDENERPYLDWNIVGPALQNHIDLFYKTKKG